jgi:N-acetylneuraminic acid mutarotase
MRLGLLLLLVMLHAEAAEWERIASLPEPNAGFVCGAIGGEIAIIGGTNWEGGTKRWLKAVHVYSPAANMWRTVRPLEAPCAYAGSGVTDAKLVFAGGSSGETTHDRLYTFNANFIATELTIQRGAVYAAGAVIANELFVAGGAAAQDQLSALSNAAMAIDLRTGQMRELAPVPGPGLGISASAACGGKLYVFGGARWDADAGEARNLSTASVYDPHSDEWRQLPTLPRANRGLTAVALDDHRILIGGGYADEAFTDEAFLFDTSSPAYVRSIPLPYPAMVALVICGEHLYCLGGEDEKKHRTAACYRIPLSAFAR